MTFYFDIYMFVLLYILLLQIAKLRQTNSVET